MTFASVRGAAQEAAKRGQLSPHQLAALGRLDEILTDDQRQEFTDLWRAEGSPAAAADPAWLAFIPKTRAFIETMQNRILVPTSFSPLQ